MISQTSEHAIRALLYLAQAPAGEAVPAERIAAALGAPANYLSKTLNALGRRGLVRGTRGAAGGFSLRRPAPEITLAEIEGCFREAKSSSVCLLGDRPCNAAQPCAAHACWSSICDEMRAPLARTTLAQLLSPPVDLSAGLRAGSTGPAHKAA